MNRALFPRTPARWELLPLPAVTTAVTTAMAYAATTGYEALHCRASGFCPADGALPTTVAFGAGAAVMGLTGVLTALMNPSITYHGAPAAAEEPREPEPVFAAESGHTRFVLESDGGRQVDYLRFEHANDQQLMALGRAVRAGNTSLAINRWTERAGSGGRLWGRAEFKAFRAELCHPYHRLAIEHNGEVVLTEKGRRWFARLAERGTTHPTGG